MQICCFPDSATSALLVNLNFIGAPPRKNQWRRKPNRQAARPKQPGSNYETLVAAWYAHSALLGKAAQPPFDLPTGTIAAVGRLDRWPGALRAALIGAAVGVLAWFVPDLVGGGDAITQRVLAGRETFALLPIVFLFRLGLGAM